MRIDVGNDKALVLIQFARNIEQVVVFAQLAHHALDAIVLLDLQFDAGDGRFAGGNLDGFQVEIGISAAQALDGNAAHRDFLHQLLVVGVQRIQPVNLVVRGFVRRRIAQHHQRVEFLKRVQCLRAFHFLRLVEDQDRPVALDHIDRPARLKIIQLFVNPPRVLAGGIEGLHIDHHHVDAGVR